MLNFVFYLLLPFKCIWNCKDSHFFFFFCSFEVRAFLFTTVVKIICFNSSTRLQHHSQSAILYDQGVGSFTSQSTSHYWHILFGILFSIFFWHISVDKWKFHFSAYNFKVFLNLFLRLCFIKFDFCLYQSESVEF